jgi:hypothetical protein
MWMKLGIEKMHRHWIRERMVRRKALELEVEAGPCQGFTASVSG